jgi:hypothetical protein
MRKGGGKSKGAGFERECAKALSLWCSYGEREDCLWRSAMSGGRATVARKSGKELASQAGDLSPINEIGQPFINTFYIEIKYYRDLNYIGLLTSKGHLYKFWQNTLTESAIYRKLPMLIARQNSYPVVVVLNRQGMIRLGLLDGNTILSSWRHGMFLVLLNEFTQWAKPL